MHVNQKLELAKGLVRHEIAMENISSEINELNARIIELVNDRHKHWLKAEKIKDQLKGVL